MDEPADDLSQEFFDIADQFINLANELGRTRPSSRISSAIMYAAARYNAFHFYALDPDPEANRERAFEYFCEQYRRMLRENISGELGRLVRRSQDQEPKSS